MSHDDDDNDKVFSQYYNSPPLPMFLIDESLLRIIGRNSQYRTAAEGP